MGLKEMIDRTVIPGVLTGMKITLKHMLTPRSAKVTPTIQYPEEKAPSFKRTRGVHYMKQDEQGRTNCVACFMCSTACPAEAITIVQTSAPAEWKDRDTYPKSYVINELRCIFCGMCEEACPKDAIKLSRNYEMAKPRPARERR